MRALRYLVILALLASAISTRADLAIALAASVQNGGSGTELVFTGTLTNTSQTDNLFLNDIVATLAGDSAANLSLNRNAFFSNVPGILLPGESYSNDELFRVVLAAGAPSADYSGTVILRGGVNIFANNDLASASFTILSPAISIVVSDPDAAELGPEAGSATVSRTGGTGIDLPFSLAITGTATNGISYNFIPSPATIVAGKSSVTLTVVPIPDDLAEGDRTAAFSLPPSSSYNLTTNSSGIVTIHDKPADDWRFTTFGGSANTPAAADAADWDNDGIQNLTEFALGLLPKAADAGALPAATISSGYLTLSFVPNPAATDVNIIVEGSIDLTTWQQEDVESVSVAQPKPPGALTFRYKYSNSERPRAYLRLRLVRTDL